MFFEMTNIRGPLTLTPRVCAKSYSNWEDLGLLGLMSTYMVAKLSVQWEMILDMPTTTTEA